MVAAKKTSIDQTREALETIKAEGEEARLNQQSARIHQEQAENRLAQLSVQYDLQMSQVSPTILTELDEEATKEAANVQALNEKKLPWNNKSIKSVIIVIVFKKACRNYRLRRGN